MKKRLIHLFCYTENCNGEQHFINTSLMLTLLYAGPI